MKIHEPENESYSATVVEIKEIHPLEGLDNIVGTTLLGFQAIISKDTVPGTIGIVFTPETQLSEEYCYQNNLHRHGNLNKDEGSSGYLEDNRRVRAVRLRGNASTALFMPLSSLSYIKGFKASELEVGTVFDKLGDHAICNKYVVKRKVTQNRVEKNKEKFIRVDKKFLPEHYDSDQWYRHSNDVDDETTIIVTQKLHGTSIRVGNTIVARKLTLADRIFQLLGAKIQKHEFDYVFGSRKVIKDANNPNQNHFYTNDIWTEEGKRLDGLVPENFVLYGELIGWVSDGVPIQRNYTYNLENGRCALFIYRVAFLNGQGLVTDLTYDQVVEFCRDRGLHPVPELWRGKKKDFVVESFNDKKYAEEGYVQAVPLSPTSPVDEGVCIRVDGLAPYILKAKSPLFYEHETRMLDQGAEDLESEGSQV